MMRLTKLAAIAFATVFSAPALAVPAPPGPTIPIPTCASTDISFASGSGASFVDCRGFFEGNLLNNNTGSNAVVDPALAALGYPAFTTYNLVPPGNIQSSLNGSTVINFGSPLFGDTWFGVRFGNGQGSPGRVAEPDAGDTTALYRINAGSTGLSSLTLNYGASSTFTLFSTQAVSAAPEPAAWAMMIVGFGAAGVALRRRRTQPWPVTA